jgi:hypothetical protein
VIVTNNDSKSTYAGYIAKKKYNLSVVDFSIRDSYYNYEATSDIPSYKIIPKDDASQRGDNAHNIYQYERLKSSEYILVQVRNFLNCITLIELNFKPVKNLVYLSLKQAKTDPTLVENEVDILSKTVEIKNNPWGDRYKVLQCFLEKYCENDEKMCLTHMNDNFNNFDWLQKSKLTYFGFNRHVRNKKTILFYLDKYHTLDVLEGNVAECNVPFSDKKKSMIGRFSLSGSLTRDNGWYQFDKMSAFAKDNNIQGHYDLAYILCSNFPRFRFCFDYRNSKLIDCGFTTCNDMFLTHFPDLIKDRLPIEEMCQYMFHICLGGNDWGSSLIWQLLNFNVVFIPYPFEFESVLTLGLIPYLHFVPLSSNLCDLDDKLQMMMQNDDLCFKLAANAHEHMKLFLRSDYHELVGERIVKTYISKANPVHDDDVDES